MSDPCFAQEQSLLSGYFDASFTQPQGVTAIGGYVGTQAQWAVAEQMWLDTLNIWSLSGFHLVDLMNGQTHLGHTRGRECALMFSKIMGKCGLHSIGAALSDSDWVASGRARDDQQVFPSKYHLCFDMVLRVIGEHIRLEFKGQQIALIFDLDTPKVALSADAKSEEVARAIFERRRDCSPHVFTSLTFSNRRAYRLLECADAYAGAFRLAWLKSKAAGSVEWTDLYVAAQGDRGRTSYWSRETEKIVEQALEKRRQMTARS